jgi:hypothetical protein
MSLQQYIAEREHEWVTGMDHARESKTGTIRWTHSILSEADTFVAPEDRSEIATITSARS